MGVFAIEVAGGEPAVRSAVRAGGSAAGAVFGGALCIYITGQTAGWGALSCPVAVPVGAFLGDKSVGAVFDFYFGKARNQVPRG